ncbi:MAG TPA: MCE family protein [Actinomycetota bacterium]|nr:MCE family protein [Actinomycetota bacterium]
MISKLQGRIALALAVGLIAASTGAIYTRRPEGTYPVTANFPRAIGLFPRSGVRVLGVEVGRVTAVVPAGDRVRVTMAIEESYRIPADATATIVPISLISDRYIQLSPVWSGGPALSPGDEIPLERGIAPAELDDLLARLKEFLASLEPGTAEEPGALGQLVTNANQALAGRGESLGTTIEGLSTLLDNLGRNAENLDSIIVSLDRIVGALARRDAQIAATNRGLATVMTTLNEERTSLESGLGNLAALTEELGRLVRENRTELDRSLAILAATTDRVVRQREGLIRNTLWLPVLSQGAYQAYEPENQRVNVRDNQQARFEP